MKNDLNSKKLGPLLSFIAGAAVGAAILSAYQASRRSLGATRLRVSDAEALPVIEVREAREAQDAARKAQPESASQDQSRAS